MAFSAPQDIVLKINDVEYLVIQMATSTPYLPVSDSAQLVTHTKNHEQYILYPYLYPITDIFDAIMLKFPLALEGKLRLINDQSLIDDPQAYTLFNPQALPHTWLYNEGDAIIIAITTEHLSTSLNRSDRILARFKLTKSIAQQWLLQAAVLHRMFLYTQGIPDQNSLHHRSAISQPWNRSGESLDACQYHDTK